jgi:DNA-binding MarR family transcriptional regulator
MTDGQGDGQSLTVVDAAAQLSFAVLEVLTRVAATENLSVTQLRVLGILRDRTPTMADLADRLGLDRSSVTGLVDRAERRGLVRRAASASDARSTVVAMTDEGRTVGARLEALYVAAVSDLLAHADDADRAALVRLTASMPRRR